MRRIFSGLRLQRNKEREGNKSRYRLLKTDIRAQIEDIHAKLPGS
jgi:hypothetical protein